MAWLMTTYEQADGGMVVMEHYTPDVTSGRHGSHLVEFHNPLGYDYDVTVYDNTEDGITEEDAEAIAEEATNTNVYWSDDGLCHWMYDFKKCGHWGEGLFHNNGLPDDVPSIWKHLHINVYD